MPRRNKKLRDRRTPQQEKVRKSKKGRRKEERERPKVYEKG